MPLKRPSKLFIYPDHCKPCPWQVKRGCPSEPAIRRDADFVIVVERPAHEDALSAKPLDSRLGRRFLGMLHERGLHRYSIIYRASCKERQNRSQPKHRKAAAQACMSRFQSQLQRADPRGDKPILWLGQFSHAGHLGKSRVAFYSGHEALLPIATLARHTMHDRYMVMGVPQVILHAGAAKMLADTEAALDKFARFVGGAALSAMPTLITEPCEAAIAALDAMGHMIAIDAETLGTDPGIPLSCVAISDGERTVSLPWNDYYTDAQGNVEGVYGSRSEHDRLWARCRDAMIRCAHSRPRVTGHNVFFDVAVLEPHGIRIRPTDDTFLACKTIWNQAPGDLESAALRLLPDLTVRWKTIFKGRDDGHGAKGLDAYINCPETVLREYNAMDAWATARCQQALDELLATED